MKEKLVFVIAFLLSLSGYAQTGLRGYVINSVTNDPVIGVAVTIQGQNRSVTTDAKGEFLFQSITAGDDILLFNSPDIKSKIQRIKILANNINEIGEIGVDVIESDNTSLIGVIDDAILSDDDDASQEISTTVILSNDVYLKQVAYQLSPGRFRARGYSSNYEQTYINGVYFNDQNRGVFNYAAIGALNDLTRNGNVVNYNNANSFTFGSIGGTTDINMRAGNYAKGGKVTLSYTNRNYYLRGMASYSTGLMDNGWAITGAVGGRYSDEGNIKGTFYRNVSYALAIEKQLRNGKHSLSLTTFGSPVQRGQQGASYQEVYNLLGDNLYNPNWGYQNGKKRNSRVVKAYDPTVVLSHIWKINDKTDLTTGIGTHYGRYGGTALNWYNGPDPRPDYYRYLPSYYANSEDIFNQYSESWRNNDKSTTQINWDELYHINGLAAMQGQKSAIYMVEERRSDLFETSLNSVLNTTISKNQKLTAGISLRHSRSKQYKTVDDLLGAEYVLDIDKFAERDFPGDNQTVQNDLNNPNKKAVEGDIFGYDFRLNINSANIWVQNQYTTRKVDFYYGTKISYTDFYRDGRMKNGRYPTSSFGKGKIHTFIDYALKAGFTYKISGRHFITGNFSYQTDAPLPNVAYISPRITDNTVDLESGKILSMDVNYIFSLPSFTGRIAVFQTNFYDQMKRVSYYHDSERTFVNHILTGMNQVHRGIEMGANYKIDNNWGINVAGTVAQYYYSNNPDGTISYENGKKEDINEKVYLNDYYIGSTPQIAGTIGLSYFYDFWFFNLNLNGFAQNYIDIAPIRRLSSNYAGVAPGTPEYEAYKHLTSQERYGSAATLDLSIGKILYLPNKHSINFNFSFNNILNRKNIRTGGYEQGRLDISSPYKFASKYYYMQGFNCFLNTSYKF